MLSPQVEYYSRNEADTARLAGRLAALAQPGWIIGLNGDLGAGKTTFSQAFARELGVSGIVNSPTFTIIKEYMGERLPFYHMDVYRISLAEAEELGLDDYFYGQGVTLVEWSERIEELLPTQRLDVYIEHLGGTERKLRLYPKGFLYEDLIVKMRENGEFE